MKKMKKILNDIRGYLPVSRREMKKIIENIVTILDGFMTASATQSQVYTGLIKEVEKLKANSAEKKPEKDVKGYQ